MIDRYSGKEMAATWTDENKFKKWLEVELAVLEAREALCEIPKGTADFCRKRVFVDEKIVSAIKKREAAIQHDLNAFVEVERLLIRLDYDAGGGDFRTMLSLAGMRASCAEEMNDAAADPWNDVFDQWMTEVQRPEAALCEALFHDGMTSFDTEEPAMARLLGEACAIVMKRLRELADAIRTRALEHRGVPMIGRTHGQHAQPVTFGTKCLNWLEMVERSTWRFMSASKEVKVMKLSGAVGMYGTLGPAVEEKVAEFLGLKTAPVATQILALDRRAQLVTSLAEIASVVEKIAHDLWLLGQTEVGEIREPFGKRQKGSSAMPHKKNPIIFEQCYGLPRLVRGYATAMLENVATANERDISHSSVERIVLPDAFGLVDHLLRRLAKVVRGMEVFPERMLNNLWSTGGVFASQKVEMLLKGKGMAAEEAYRLVQRYSAAAIEARESLLTLLKGDAEIAAVASVAELKDCFDLAKWTAAEGELYRRMGLG